MKHFYANLTFAQATEYLQGFTTEEIRQLIEEGVFGDKMNGHLRKYLHVRIVSGKK